MHKSLNLIVIVLLISSNLATSLHLIRLHQKNKQYSESESDFIEGDNIANLYSTLEFEKCEDSLVMLLMKEDDFPAFLKANDRILLFINEEDCQSCILQFFMDIDLLIPEILDSTLIILGNYKKESDFNNILSILPGNCNSLNITNIPYTELGLKTPFLVVLTQKLSFKYFFLPTHSKELKEFYFNNILKEWFRNIYNEE